MLILSCFPDIEDYFFPGLPVLIIFVFYVVTYLIYRFVALLPEDKIYGDVLGNRDM